MPGVARVSKLLDPWILWQRSPIRTSLSRTSFFTLADLSHVGDANSIIATSTSPLDAEESATSTSHPCRNGIGTFSHYPQLRTPR